MVSGVVTVRGLLAGNPVMQARVRRAAYTALGAKHG